MHAYPAAILGVLASADCEFSGAEVQRELHELGYRKTSPAFYAAMARLEKAGFVTSKQVEESIRGRTFSVKVYKIEGEGMHSLKEWMNVAEWVSSRALALTTG